MLERVGACVVNAQADAPSNQCSVVNQNPGNRMCAVTYRVLRPEWRSIVQAMPEYQHRPPQLAFPPRSVAIGRCRPALSPDEAKAETLRVATLPHAGYDGQMAQMTAGKTATIKSGICPGNSGLFFIPFL